MLSYLLEYWNTYEYNSLIELLAIGIVPSIFFLVIIGLLMKIVHMHKHNTSRVVKYVLAKQRKEIELYNEYLHHQEKFEQLKTERLEHNKNVNDAFSKNNLLREKVARYKTADDEIKNRYKE